MTEHGGTHGQPADHSAGGDEGTSGAAEFDLGGSGAKPLQVEDPTWIGDIPLLGRLGSGGTGRVYLGLLDGEYAAVKQVHPHLAEDPAFVRRFGRELDDLAQLPSDAGAAPLLAGDREARPPWFATAYAPGLTLGQALELNGGPFAAPAVWRLLRHLAAGLRDLHARGLVHGDLKPSNVLLTEEGVTLIDFGIARAAEQGRLTGTGAVTGTAAGTPPYVAPEQAAGVGDSTPAADVYALGSLLALAATGMPPSPEGPTPEAPAPEAAFSERTASGASDRPEAGDPDPAAPDAPERTVLGDPERAAPDVPGLVAPEPTASGVPERAATSVPGLAASDRAASGASDLAAPDVPERAVPDIPDRTAPDASGTPDRTASDIPHLAALRERDAEVAELVAACLDGDPDARPTAQELLDRAAPHTADAARSWPAPVQDRLVACAAFVSRARPVAAQLPPRPDASSGTLLVVPEEPAPEEAPARPERRRRRTLLAAAAVLLAAGIPLALQLLPDSSPATGAGSRPGTSGPRATVPGAGTPASPAAPTSQAAPSDSPRRSTRPAVPPATASGSSGPVASAAAAPSDAGSAAPTTPATAPPPHAVPTGSQAYRNGRSGSCLSSRGLGNSLTLGSCSADAAQWTLQPVPGGYHLVNEATSRCLQAGRLTTAATLAGCDSTDAVLTWSPGSAGSLAAASDGKCLYVAYLATAPTGIGTATCDGSPAQAWQRG